MLCALCAKLRPRVPRGLRALTAPAPSSSSGSYVMAGHVAAHPRGRLRCGRFRRRLGELVDISVQETLTRETRRKRASVVLRNKSRVLLIDDNSGATLVPVACRPPARDGGTRLDSDLGSGLSVLRRAD